MAETEETAAPSGCEATDSLTYKTPAPKSLKEIQEMDKDDPSLVKYKKSLLGEDIEVEATGKGPQVKLEELALLVDDHDAIKLDLKGDLAKLKEKIFVIKEGICYRARLTFKVSGDIVSGLKYVQTCSRLGVKCDSSKFMLGSYPPRKKAIVYEAPIEEFSKGLMARGHYTVHSKFSDDDERDFLSWDWAFDLKKDWE